MSRVKVAACRANPTRNNARQSRKSGDVASTIVEPSVSPRIPTLTKAGVSVACVFPVSVRELILLSIFMIAQVCCQRSPKHLAIRWPAIPTVLGLQSHDTLASLNCSVKRQFPSPEKVSVQKRCQVPIWGIRQSSSFKSISVTNYLVSKIGT